MTIIYCTANDLRRLGVSRSIHTCYKVAKRIRDSTGEKQMHYKKVAQYFNLDEDLVLSVILGNNEKRLYKGKSDLLVTV